MGKKLYAALLALCVTASTAFQPTAVSAKDQTGPALVVSNAREIHALRQSPAKSDAWVFRLKLSSTRPGKAESVEIVVTVSDDNYTTYETQTGLSILDHKLQRVFSYHKESNSFINGSISAAAAFAVWEWQSRAKIAQVNAAMFKDEPESLKKLPMLNDFFWISHDLGLALPNAPEDGAEITRNGDKLRLFRRDEEVATLSFGEQSIPKTVLQRLWGVIQRLRPVHPSLPPRAISQGNAPKHLRSKLYLGEQLYFVELTFEAASKVRIAYPLPAAASLRTPSGSEPGTEMMEIGGRAMAGDFATGTPDNAFWVERFETALGKENMLESFLTFYAFTLFTSDERWAKCDQHNHMGNEQLCGLLRKAIALGWRHESIGQFLAAVGAQDHEARIAAIKFLKTARKDGGEMAPLISLFIANHIEVVTQTITSSSDESHPNRAEAEPLFLEALRAFPFTRSIYGDIAKYYINFFSADRAYFFADVGRNLPVATSMRGQAHLMGFTQTGDAMRRDFPLFF